MLAITASQVIVVVAALVLLVAYAVARRWPDGTRAKLNTPSGAGGAGSADRSTLSY